MQPAPLPRNEACRLEALYRYHVLDTPAAEGFDNLIQLTSMVCQVPISLVSLIDEKRQWFKARLGLAATETDRDLAFCAHAILQPDIFEVPDAAADPRFADNPLVQGAPHIRFYAGMPLVNADGFALGTLCVIDRVPRTLTPLQRQTLQILGVQVIAQLELHRQIDQIQQAEASTRQALTREKELSDLKTRFIAMASHEFRTPLTTILASAETLERYSHKFTPEKQQVVLKRIQTSVHQLIDLLNDMLSVNKAESGKLDCTLAPVNLQQVCRDLAEEVQLAQVDNASPIEFTATGENFQVLADEKLLRHILINLLSNAVKYSPDLTPVSFTLSCRADQIVMQVCDRGIGIPAADQAQMFSAFHRAQNVGDISGTGLGLVIAKRAAEAHHGQISCVSEVGIGTTFTVVLPLVMTCSEVE